MANLSIGVTEWSDGKTIDDARRCQLRMYEAKADHALEQRKT